MTIDSMLIERDQLERYMTTYRDARTPYNVMRQDELDYDIELHLRTRRPLA